MFSFNFTSNLLNLTTDVNSKGQPVSATGAAEKAAQKLASSKAGKHSGFTVSPSPTKPPPTPAQQSATVLAAQKVISAKAKKYLPKQRPN